MRCSRRQPPRPPLGVRVAVRAGVAAELRRSAAEHGLIADRQQRASRCLNARQCWCTFSSYSSC